MLSDLTVFVDTNVFVYSFDERDPIKQKLAQKWITSLWQSRTGVISTQVLNELYNVACKKFTQQKNISELRNDIQLLRVWRTELLDHDTIDDAWALQDKFNFSYWDALIVSCARQAGCKILLSEDLQSDLNVEGLRIINPFTTAPETVI